MKEISVCIGTSCHLKGSYNIIQTFQQLIEEKNLHDRINLKASFCMKTCSKSSVTVKIDGKRYNISAQSAFDFFNDKILPSI